MGMSKAAQPDAMTGEEAAAAIASPGGTGATGGNVRALSHRTLSEGGTGLKISAGRCVAVAISLAGILSAALLGSIPAAASGTPGLTLAFFSGGKGARAHWTTKDLPPNTHLAIQLVNPLPTGETYTGATVKHVSGMTMSQITQLSFMIDTDHYMGAGAPRFSVILSDGVVLFPSAGDCPLTPNTGWQTASFAGPDTCIIYGSENYSATQPWATWSEWSSQLNNPTIDQLVIVQDEGPATVYLANVSVNGSVAH